MYVARLLTEGGQRGVKHARRPYIELWEQDSLLGASSRFEIGEKRPRLGELRAASKVSLEWLASADQAVRRRVFEATDLNVCRLGYAGGGGRFGVQVLTLPILLLSMLMIVTMRLEAALWMSGILLGIPILLASMGFLFMRSALAVAARQQERLLVWRRDGSAR